MKKAISILLLIGLIGTIFYTLYENHHFLIREQEITIDRLPQSFDGFRILQITDLHGSYFGEVQADLLKVINSIDYDIIVFTGDMNDSTTSDDSIEKSKAVLDLVDGIANKKDLYWIDGNTGPYAIKTSDGIKTGDLTEIGTVLQAKGCKILLLPEVIKRGNDKIWITPEMSEMIYSMDRSMLENEKWLRRSGNGEKFRSFYQKSYQFFQEIKGNGEVKILLTHIPLQINATAEERKLNGDLDYDLILAGHYHGGQLRLPIIGALYIPSPTTGINNSGILPAQEAVVGLSYYGNVPQYVSAGLGASGHLRLAGFRLFNPPEINVITLKRR